MKVIFLDIDGVLITSNNDLHEITANTHRTESSNGFDESAVENLNRLLETTDARIVISSSMRMSNSISQLTAILKSGGVHNPRIIDVTPYIPDRRTNRSHRGKEILAWLSSHPDVENYIVIDDCDGRQLAGIPERHIVNTTGSNGFGDTRAYQTAVSAMEKEAVA